MPCLLRSPAPLFQAWIRHESKTRSMASASCHPPGWPLLLPAAQRGVHAGRGPFARLGQRKWLSRNFCAALWRQSCCCRTGGARGWRLSGSTVASPRPTCCSEQGRWPGPRGQGARGAPVEAPLRSAPSSWHGRGMPWWEPTAWLSPGDKGMAACPHPASPARVPARSEQAHPLPPRQLIRGRPRTGISRRGSGIPP